MDTVDIEFLLAWAKKHDAQFELDGTCGFGRPCVGIIKGSGYIDLGPQENLYADRPDETPFWYTKDDDPDVTPDGVPDAYHKHPCLAVLVHGDDRDSAIEQLARWCRHLDEQGYTVVTAGRKGVDNIISLMMHGTTTTFLTKTPEDYA